MSHTTKQDKKSSETPKTSRRFATPEEAADAKNAGLVTHLKKIGLKSIVNTATPSK